MPDSHATHPNVVPMIDVIMCLIIFYMLVARIGVNTGEDERIKIPFGALGKEIKSMDNTLLVNVKEANGLPEVTAMVDASSGKREPLVLEDAGSGRKLVEVLARLRFGKDNREGGTGDNKDNPDLKLVIRGDADMSFGILQKVLLAAAQAKVKALNFQTSTDQRSTQNTP
ncbi:MAG: biopolymer transporter ExbD [Burkholderiales bacterium]|nr:biopolymer transporter ExbD [Phycisphaerae bacterium]